MRKILFMACVLCLSVGYALVPNDNLTDNKTDKPDSLANLSMNASEELYNTLGLIDEGIDLAAFEKACDGYEKIGNKQREVLTLIDFTKPSTDVRMFVIDMKQRKVLFKTHVAHGQNSGENYATSFSNRNGSHQSSLGFYLTGNTYIGKKGYSLKLNGLEAGINDNAFTRGVVIHAAAYANPSVIPGQGRLGRSHGCPALPEALNRPVIDAIKDGSVLFIYADNTHYLAQSRLLSRQTSAGAASS